jgi:hypothetical protein
MMKVCCFLFHSMVNLSGWVCAWLCVRVSLYLHAFNLHVFVCVLFFQVHDSKSRFWFW